MNLLELQLNEWRARCQMISDQCAADLRQERARVDELSNQLMQQMNITQEPKEKLDPIQTLPMSWPRARRRLEQIDRSKVSRKEPPIA